MICTLTIILVSAIVGKIIYGIIKRKITKVDFSGKTVWITGAASGIGEQMAYEFSRVGASLILSDLGLDGLKKVKEACQSSDKVTIVKMDMSNF
jgi:NADP-dependent 3-hydroxy acid dehydrogenase YdfG